ncbi:MAG: hypothetical protein JW913_06685 [Chitinispirillaceae bacterium]|nr:hypothetical protein [Chitinispirillaceae bacterium]
MNHFHRLFLSTFFFLCTAAARTGRGLQFIVIDSVTGKTVEHAKVCINRAFRAFEHCDSNGYCIAPLISSAENIYWFTAPGYDTVKIALSVSPVSASPSDTVMLHPIGHIASLEKMVVREERLTEHYLFSSTSLVSFDQSDFLATAGTGKDINRVLALCASTVSMGTFDDNGILVRGGAMTENAYVVDGIIFDNINHYAKVKNPGGSFGFIDMDMVERLDFYTGGIPAGLPSRSSSVIDITLRKGSIDRGSYKAEVNVLGAGVSSDGPLFSTGGTYALGFRFADMSFLNYFIAESGTPRHVDGELKVNVDLRNCGNLSLTIVGSWDSYRVDHDDWDYDIDTYSENGSDNAGAGIAWSQNLSRWINTLHFTATHGKAYQFRDNLEDEAELILEQNIVKDTMRNGTVRWDVSRKELTDRRIHSLSLHKNKLHMDDHIARDIGDHLHLSAGVSAEYQRYYSHYKWSVRRTYYELCFGAGSSGSTPVALNDTLFTGYGLIDYDNDSVFVNYLYTGYLQLLATAGPFRILPGVRVEYFSLLGKWGISPRIGCTYDKTAAGRFSVSGSMIRQLPTMFDRLLDRTLCDNCSRPPPMDKLELQRCFQVNAAWTRSFGRRATAGMEVFGKWYDREYPFIAPEVRSYGYYFNSDEKGSYRTVFHPPDGRRKVFGGEAYLRGQTFDRFHYAGTFSLFRARDRYTDGYWYGDAYGVCRKLALMAGVNAGKSHSVSTGLMVMSGRRYTSDREAYSNAEGKKTYYNEALEPIISLSLKYSFRHDFRRCSIGTNIDLVNVLNQKIVIDREPAEFGYVERRLDGILPIMGIWVAF